MFQLLTLSTLELCGLILGQFAEGFQEFLWRHLLDDLLVSQLEELLLLVQRLIVRILGIFGKHNVLRLLHDLEHGTFWKIKERGGG